MYKWRRDDDGKVKHGQERAPNPIPSGATDLFVEVIVPASREPRFGIIPWSVFPVYFPPYLVP
jgi:hypothetical protein